MSGDDKNKLETLKKFMIDYSYQERRNIDLLNKISDLMSWALDHKILTGMSIKEVERIIGPPSITVGEGKDEDIEWLYPCVADVDEKIKEDQFKWYWQLNFRFHILEGFEKRKWLLSDY